MSCVAIASVGYYQRQADQTARELAAFASGVDADLLRTARSNYYDNGTAGATELSIDGAFGTFAVLQRDLELVTASGKTGVDPFRDLIDGAPAHPDVVRALAAGRDPGTRKILVETTHHSRVAGYDLQLSAPKSVSILALLGSEEIRRSIIRAHDRAIRAVLDYIAREGLFQCRTGKGGAHRSGARKLVATLYRHYTSRKNDPQLHTHCVLFNVAIREDGTIGGIDNLQIKRFGGAIEALYRCELAAGLRQSLHIEVVHHERNFEIAGFDRALVEAFSKRRLDILAVAAAEQFSTAMDRGAAQRASYKTRPRKDDSLDLATLQRHWIAELAAFGLTPDSLVDRVRASSEAVRLMRSRAEFDRDADRRTRMAELIQKNVIVTQPHLLRICAEAGQIDMTLEQALSSAQTVADSLVRLPTTTDSPPLYLDSIAIKLEHAMLKSAHSCVGRWQPPPDIAIQAAIEAAKSLSQEQADAVRWVLRGDGIVCLEGSAGSGKSRSCSVVVDALEASGFEVTVLSPSWRATDVVRRETGVLSERAMALQGFSLALANGSQKLTSQSVILIDEAGMAGLVDVSILVEAVAQAGAKAIFVGDTRQLQPVSAGAPMSALAKLLGSQRINTIKRQREPWMQEASMAMAAGDGARGIEAYFERGAIRPHASRAHTLVAAMLDYVEGLPQDEPERLIRAGEPSRILLADWNKDVADLNMLVRGTMVARGLIAPDGVTFDAIPRGGRNDRKPVPLTLAAHDRIIFGERIRVDDITVFNSDLATVTDVRHGSKEPILSIRLDRRADDGSIIAFSAPISRLVRPRREPGSAPAPRIQHAHCLTCHAAQGMTVDSVVIANLRGMAAEDTYVAMTRHRDTVTMHLDEQRIIDNTTPARIDLSRAGTLRTAEDSDIGVPPNDPELHDAVHARRRDALVLQSLKREASRRNSKTSPSDYVPDLDHWLKSSDPVRSLQLGLKPAAMDVQIRERMVVRQTRPQSRTYSFADPLAFTPEEAAIVSRQSVPDLLLGKLDCREIPVPAETGNSTTRMFEHSKTGVRVALGKADAIVWASEAPTTEALPTSEPQLVKIVMALAKATITQARRLIRTVCAIWQDNPLAAAARRAAARRAASTSPYPSAPSIVAARMTATGASVTEEELIAEQALEDDERSIARHRSVRHRLRQSLQSVAPVRTNTMVIAISEEEILAEQAQRDNERTVARHRSARHRLRQSLRSALPARTMGSLITASEEEVLAEQARQDDERTVIRHRSARQGLRQTLRAPEVEGARRVAPIAMDEPDRLPSPAIQPEQVEAKQAPSTGADTTRLDHLGQNEMAQDRSSAVPDDPADRHRIAGRPVATASDKQPAPISPATTAPAPPPLGNPATQNRGSWAHRSKKLVQPVTRLLIGLLDKPIPDTAPESTKDSPPTLTAENAANQRVRSQAAVDATVGSHGMADSGALVQKPEPPPRAAPARGPGVGAAAKQPLPNDGVSPSGLTAPANPGASATKSRSHPQRRSPFPGLDPDKMVIREYDGFLNEIRRSDTKASTSGAASAAIATKPGISKSNLEQSAAEENQPATHDVNSKREGPDFV
ncbi:MobF family relaxase [Bosea sp. R86505]|uniref:MobF family relaxase n=1 Tax=Bosea sp. R86505 TaxID=3101710 RepID=UPI00366EFAF2